MRTMICFLLAMSFTVGVTGCMNATDPTELSSVPIVQATEPTEAEIESENYRDHQELTDTEAEFDSSNMLRFDIPEVGLENVFVADVCRAVMLDSGAFGDVYLLADDRYGGGCMPADHYLAIVTASKKIQVKDLSAWENQACYSGQIHLCDFDGDGDDEIALQQTVSMTGGAGQYLSRVFDYSGGEIVEIFISNDGEGCCFDMGYTATVLKDRRLRIDNSFTGFSMTLQYGEGNDELFDTWWYDENGDPKESFLLVDSFYSFVPKDDDGDGVYEIHCRQYTSLIGHSNYIGDAVSVLKYNKDSGKFEMIEAGFEPLVDSYVEILE